MSDIDPFEAAVKKNREIKERLNAERLRDSTRISGGLRSRGAAKRTTFSGPTTSGTGSTATVGPGTVLQFRRRESTSIPLSSSISINVVRAEATSSSRTDGAGSPEATTTIPET